MIYYSMLRHYFLVYFQQIILGLYNEGDGHIDPYSLTQALATGARKHGAKIYQSAEVTSMRQTEDGGWEVQTPQGSIRTQNLVNSSGMY